MARRSKNKGRKQAQRVAKLLPRALARGDALEFVPLSSEASPPPEPLTVAQIFAKDVAGSLRRMDSARLLRLATVEAMHTVELGALGEWEAMAARWTILGVCLVHGRIERARTLVGELEPFLRERAPHLIPWLDAALEGGGRVLPTAAEEFVEPSDELPAVAFEFPKSFGTVEEFSRAVLAGSVLLHPVVLGDRITRHLAEVDAASRTELALAALPIVRLRALEVAAVADREGLRGCLDLLASLCTYHRDIDALGLGLRLLQFLKPEVNSKDLRSMSHVVELASTCAELRPLASAAFEALSPEPDLRGAALMLGRKMLAEVGSGAVWGHVWLLWQQGEEDDPPSWLVDAYPRLVRDGELSRWLSGVDAETRRKVVDRLDRLDWPYFLELAEQLWDRVPAFEHVWLSSIIDYCLDVPEIPSPDSTDEGIKGATVAALRQRVASFSAGLGGGPPPPEVLEFEERLDALPPGRTMPPEFVRYLEILMVAEAYEMGPRQRAFIDRMGERVVPHSLEFLHRVLHQPDLLRDGERWIDIHLGPEPQTSDLLAIAEMVWSHGWPALDAHIQGRIESHAERGVEELLELFRSLTWTTDGPAALIRCLARKLLAAHERGEPGIDRWMLRKARRIVPKPRKKKAAKKKTAAKKTAAKKTAKKKTAAKKKTTAAAKRQLDLKLPS